MSYTKEPKAVKYFFDLLDRQADAMKITEPDVLHIWKTNRHGRAIAGRQMEPIV